MIPVPTLDPLLTFKPFMSIPVPPTIDELCGWEDDLITSLESAAKATEKMNSEVEAHNSEVEKRWIKVFAEKRKEIPAGWGDRVPKTHGERGGVKPWFKEFTIAIGRPPYIPARWWNRWESHTFTVGGERRTRPPGMNSLLDYVKYARREKAAALSKNEQVKKAVAYLEAQGKKFETDFSYETATMHANDLATEREVERLEAEGGYHDFAGRNACESGCAGWNPKEGHHCQCGAHRVAWETAYGSTFEEPLVFASTY